MTCHNGAAPNSPIWSGTGLQNPHAFGSAAYIDCTSCHGGDPTPGQNRTQAHVAPPPQFRTDQQLIADPVSYFNFLTKTGLDKYPDWTSNGNTVTGLDWLQFMNPGDTRVVAAGRGCGLGGCHGGEHGDWVLRSPLNTEVGFYSATNYTMGLSNVNGNTNYTDTAADLAFRAVTDPSYAGQTNEIGRVGSLQEYPEYAQFGRVGGDAIFQNPGIRFDTIPNDIHDGNFGQDVNQIIDGTDLSHLVQEVIAANCGDCHLGSMGANNRYADFRSSGCTACHMEYAMDGKTRSSDPNVNRNEPFNPDAIATPERPHVEAHQIRNVAKILPGGGFVRGVSDNACVGCHQGSNRTVLQFWGIRMDQNRDVALGFQYPEDPDSFTDTANDARLYPAAVNNNTFNGRDFLQHLLEEDYDGDGLDDTPPDAHYEAGMGCIDCHGSMDVHAGTEGAATLGIRSHQSQAMGITCESCHGDIDYEPPTVACVDYAGQSATCATDRFGNPLRNVTVSTTGGYNHFWLRSRVTGAPIYVPLTKDTVDYVGGKTHPINQQPLYSPNASYAMGRIGIGGTPTRDADGTGPAQANPQMGDAGFSHSDILDCNACHASWTNNCIGCHLHVYYNADPLNFFFSNTTGERTVINFDAFFTYQSPVMKYLVVGTQGKVTQGQPGMKMFFRYQDLNGQFSDVFAFTDRNGFGNVPAELGRNAFPALAHNKIAPHSTRGRQSGTGEGVNACQVCHLNTAMFDNQDNDANGVNDDVDYANYINFYLDLNDFQGMFDNGVFAHQRVAIGLNTGNQLNLPTFVAMTAGLGTGMFLFDANGCPVNPFDDNANRFFCDGTAPADNFAAAVANNTLNDLPAYDLDRTVERTGFENVSMSQPIVTGLSPLRSPSLNAALSGPIGGLMIDRLTNPDPNIGLVLDAWIDPDGNAQGNAANFVF